MKFYNHQSVRSSVECFHCGQIEAERVSGHQAFQVGLTRRGHWTGFPSLFLSYDDYPIRPHTSAVAVYVPYILRAAPRRAACRRWVIQHNMRRTWTLALAVRSSSDAARASSSSASSAPPFSCLGWAAERTLDGHHRLALLLRRGLQHAGGARVIPASFETNTMPSRLERRGRGVRDPIGARWFIRAPPTDAAAAGVGGATSLMTPALEARLEEVTRRHEELCASLTGGNSDLGGNQQTALGADEMTRVNKELARTERVVSAYAALRGVRDEMASLREMMVDDAGGSGSESGDESELADMAREEHAALVERLPRLEEDLAHLLLPADEADEAGAIVEVRAGAGGDEAAIFARDLLRMYELYARRRGWRFELLSTSTTESGGYKEASASLAGDDAYGTLKFESGVHRVQRIPVTETQGRVHTSTASVAVLPQAEDFHVDVKEADLKVETMRASGAGGQHVNTTNSAVRITHLPSGVVVSMQDERSQHKNREKAMKVLRARIFAAERARVAEVRAEQRRSLIGSGDRSERVRTYNYKEGRVKDHRVGVQVNDLRGMMDGQEAMQEIVDALRLEEKRQMLLDFQT